MSTVSLAFLCLQRNEIDDVASNNPPLPFSSCTCSSEMVDATTARRLHQFLSRMDTDMSSGDGKGAKNMLCVLSKFYVQHLEGKNIGAAALPVLEALEAAAASASGGGGGGAGRAIQAAAAADPGRGGGASSSSSSAASSNEEETEVDGLCP